MSKKLIATYRAVSINSYTECLKLYLSFDRWVNDPHMRREVKNSARLLGELITLIKLCFPRTDGNGTRPPRLSPQERSGGRHSKFQGPFLERIGRSGRGFSTFIMGPPPPTDRNNSQPIAAIQCDTNGLSLRALVRTVR